MAISDDKIRIMVTITKTENQILKELAQKENRSVSNLASTLLKQYIDENNIEVPNKK